MTLNDIAWKDLTMTVSEEASKILKLPQKRYMIRHNHHVWRAPKLGERDGFYLDRLSRFLSATKTSAAER